jgi:hypothetical protein
VVIATPEGERSLPNDFVLALTGYHPDFEFMKALGIRSGEDDCPMVNTETLESNVPGIYLAGVIIAGRRTNEIFIENGRFHGAQIARDLMRKLQPRQPRGVEGRRGLAVVRQFVFSSQLCHKLWLDRRHKREHAIQPHPLLFIQPPEQCMMCTNA